MPTLTEDLAVRYALAVHRVLADDFSDLATTYLGMRTRREISRQAISPDHRFEVIVTYTREWRLTTETTGWDRWRVRLCCYKNRPTGEDAAREKRINEALRAIPHPYDVAEED